MDEIIAQSPSSPAPCSAAGVERTRSEKPILSLTATVAPDNVIEIVLADGNKIVREFKTADTWKELRRALYDLAFLWERSEKERLTGRQN